MKAFRATAALAAILAYGLIVLGAVVRGTNSGLSCPDWPTCYGHWVLTPSQFATLPPTGYAYYQVMLEWMHRLVAGVFLGPLILLLALAAFLGRQRRPLVVAWAALAMLVLLVVQGALGRLTVLDQNSPWSVALHLGTALLLLSSILFILVRSGEGAGSGRSAAVGGLAAAAWVVAFLAMLAAAVTAKSNAALACSTWPLCDGRVIPDLADPLIRIHFAHRVLAAATGLLVLALAAAAVRTRYRLHALAVLLLVACQIGLGALVIVLRVQTAEAVAHQAVGVLTFALLTALMWRALRPLPPRRTAPTIGETHGLALRGA